MYLYLITNKLNPEYDTVRSCVVVARDSLDAYDQIRDGVTINDHTQPWISTGTVHRTNLDYKLIGRATGYMKPGPVISNFLNG